MLKSNCIKGTPVSISGSLLNVKGASDGKILTRLLSPLRGDGIITCITPHGTIIKSGILHIEEITDTSELDILNTLEEQAEESGYKPYNGLL